MKPADRSLNHPPLFPEAGALRAFGFCDLGLDLALAQLPVVAVRPIGTVGEQLLWSFARTTEFAAHRWDLVDERDQLGDVVAVGGGQRDRQRDSFAAGDQMVLGARSSAVGRAWARVEPPKSALICEESITARDQSISSALLSLAKSTPCNSCHTPASFHS